MRTRTLFLHFREAFRLLAHVWTSNFTLITTDFDFDRVPHPNIPLEMLHDLVLKLVEEAEKAATVVRKPQECGPSLREILALDGPKDTALQVPRSSDFFPTSASSAALVHL